MGTGRLLVSDWYRDQACFEVSLRQFTDNWGAFQRIVGETLSASTKALGDAALAALPHLWEQHLAERMAMLRHITLSHDDCYLSQFLCPMPGSPDAVTYLVDFQDACGDLPAMDLVFLFATFWTPEQRHEHQREKRLMRAYLDALTGHGVTGYFWDDLVRDYRIALAFMFFYPVWDALDGSNRDYWEPKLRCLSSAVDDWGCRELFASAMRDL